ncbi:SCO4225 family membrane protein [Streptomyces clavifer]|uniref:SCO4225 family membrane protein n=1 Tax=Streptomyces clavifer TaxID=68188 RepID=UPI00382B341C
MPAPGANPARSILRRLYNNLGPIGLGYLAVCTALFVWAWVVSIQDRPDASMAMVIPFLATAPVSFLFLMLQTNTLVFVTAIGVGAAVNATIIGRCTRKLRQGGGPAD